jgi:PTS system mannose-specific IIA component
LRKKTSEAANEFTEDGCLIFTDIMGGSATNVSIEIMKSRNDVYVVTGVNLPMLLEAINSRESSSLKDLANQVSNSGTRSIINLKEYFEKRAKR